MTIQLLLSRHYLSNLIDSFLSHGKVDLLSVTCTWAGGNHHINRLVYSYSSEIHIHLPKTYEGKTFCVTIVCSAYVLYCSYIIICSSNLKSGKRRMYVFSFCGSSAIDIIAHSRTIHYLCFSIRLPIFTTIW